MAFGPEVFCGVLCFAFSLSSRDRLLHVGLWAIWFFCDVLAIQW